MYTITIADEAKVVGQNSEIADAGNPCGDIIGTVYFLTAKAHDGKIYRHFYQHQDQNKVNLLGAKVISHVMRHPDWSPNLRHWSFWRNEYGSQAYLINPT